MTKAEVRGEEWTVVGPSLEEVRRHAKVPIRDLLQRIESILWGHENGAKWRSMPAEYGVWLKPAQTFND